jgi:hypothetical protein
MLSRLEVSSGGKAPTRVGAVWTAEENATLLRLRREGMAYSLIAERLSRTPSSVQRHHECLSCSNPNVARRFWPKEEEELLLKLAGEGAT